MRQSVTIAPRHAVAYYTRSDVAGAGDIRCLSGCGAKVAAKDIVMTSHQTMFGFGVVACVNC